MVKGFLNLFRKDEDEDAGSAKVLEDRLQTIIAYKRNGANGEPPWVNALRQDMIAVIKKYPEVGNDDLSIMTRNDGDDVSILEINVMVQN